MTREGCGEPRELGGPETQAYLGFDEQVLQVEEQVLVDQLVDECRSDTRLAAASRAADAVHVVFDFLGHCGG